MTKIGVTQSASNSDTLDACYCFLSIFNMAKKNKNVKEIKKITDGKKTEYGNTNGTKGETYIFSPLLSSVVFSV